MIEYFFNIDSNYQINLMTKILNNNVKIYNII
jgi:hypothetical protein